MAHFNQIACRKMPGEISRGRVCDAGKTDGFENMHTYDISHTWQPRPFIWTAKAADILEKVTRARAPE